MTPPRRRKRRFVPPPPEDEREVWCVRAFYLAVAAVLISLAALSPQAADKLGPVLTTLLRLGGLPQ
ncbi:MAG TPA: hypothetical protein VEA38_11630 [Terriglobales bacterium]|nr:hypothetical protein [Terriglobales bacterium]